MDDAHEEPRLKSALIGGLCRIDGQVGASHKSCGSPISQKSILEVLESFVQCEERTNLLVSFLEATADEIYGRTHNTYLDDTVDI